MSIFISILIFGLIIVIHELGHFLFARRAGILVEEFAVGMGPQIAKIKRGETVWSIRAIPFGGFCKMLGEDDAGGGLSDQGSGPKNQTDRQSDSQTGEMNQQTNEPSNQPEIDLAGRSYTDKTIGQRFLVIFGGPFFNFLLAFVFALIYLFIVGGVSRTIDQVPEEYPAYEAGIRSGDVLVGYNGKRIISASELRLYLNQERPDSAVIEVKRPTDNGMEKLTFDIVPDVGEDGLMRIGINFKTLDMRNPLQLIGSAAVEVIYWIRIVLYSLTMLLTGGISGGDVAGPVGLVGVISDGYSESVQYGFTTVLATMSFYIILISANLGVMNLLPIPALDGGRLMFIAYEAIFRKPVDPEVEGRIHFVGFILLMGLMILVLFNDIARVFVG